MLPTAAKPCAGLKEKESMIPNTHSLSLHEERAGDIAHREN